MFRMVGLPCRMFGGACRGRSRGDEIEDRDEDRRRQRFPSVHPRGEILAPHVQIGCELGLPAEHARGFFQRSYVDSRTHHAVNHYMKNCDKSTVCSASTTPCSSAPTAPYEIKKSLVSSRGDKWILCSRLAT